MGSAAAEAAVVLVHVEFPAGSAVGERVFSRIAPAAGLLCGRHGTGAVFVRGSGVVVDSGGDVLTSGALFPAGAGHHRSVSVAFASAAHGAFFPAELVALSAVGDASSSRLCGVAARLRFVEKPCRCPPAAAAVAVTASEIPRQGAPVTVVGVAFGVADFAGALFRGCVATAPLPRSGLFLVDARATPGTEGALVCCARSQAPLGVLLRSLGPRLPSLSVVAPLSSVAALSLPPPPPPLSESPLSRALQSVVLLTRGRDRWASGIVVDASQRLVLTCAHFLRGINSDEKLLCCGKHPATVVFCASEELPWDVALVRVSEGAFHAEADISQDGIAGDAAFVVGFHVLGPADSSHADAGPVCLRGTLSKAVPGMLLLVSAPAFEGASGGAVFDERGCVLGLSTGNLEGAGGAPAVCLAVPSAVLRGILAAGSVDAFHASAFPPGSERRSHVESLWALSFDFRALPHPKL